MTKKPKLAKKHIDRLVQMISWHDREEAEMQERYGDHCPGSMRASKKNNAASLRVVLAFVQAVQA